MHEALTYQTIKKNTQNSAKAPTWEIVNKTVRETLT